MRARHRPRAPNRFTSRHAPMERPRTPSLEAHGRHRLNPDIVRGDRGPHALRAFHSSPLALTSPYRNGRQRLRAESDSTAPAEVISQNHFGIRTM